MTVGLVANKLGMTRVFSDNGQSIPVTVLEVYDNTVVQAKTADSDGYKAIQVGYGKKKLSKVNKAIAGHYAKAKVEPGKGLLEFRLSDAENSFEVGQVLDVSLFADTKSVDVTAVSKGKGFAGVVKRHNFRTQDATHGNSLSHRAPGSIGQNQTPGRVFKGKKMAGQMGNVQTTVQNLELIKIDQERNLLFVKGGVPGAVSSTVVVKPAIKTLQKESA